MILTAVSVYFLYESLKHAESAVQSRYQSYIVAEQVRQSSDQLSLMARAYVVTGNIKYRQFYEKILAIRNGHAARPEYYHRVYWDMLMPDGGVAPFNESEKRSLHQLLLSLGISEQEMRQLSDAEAASNELTEIEFAAFSIVENLTNDKPESIRFSALQTLYDDRYFRAKAKIMSHINNFLLMLDHRTKQSLDSASANHQRMIVISIISFITLLIVLFLITREKKNIVQEYVSELEKSVSQKTTALNDKSKQLKVSTKLMSNAREYLIDTEKNRSIAGVSAEVANEANNSITKCFNAVSKLNEENAKAVDALLQQESEKEKWAKYIDSQVELTEVLNTHLASLAVYFQRIEQVSKLQGTDELTEIDLTEQFLMIVDAVMPITKKHQVKLVSSIEPDMSFFSFPVSLNHIVINLIINACVHAFKDQQEAVVSLSAMLINDSLHLVVEDNGRGMEKEVREKMFQPFFTTSDQANYTGLGLYTVFELVTKTLAGTISCETSHEEGTRFKLVLPNLIDKGKPQDKEL